MKKGNGPWRVRSLFYALTLTTYLYVISNVL